MPSPKSINCNAIRRFDEDCCFKTESKKLGFWLAKLAIDSAYISAHAPSIALDILMSVSAAP
jgi:hypothetical protein